MSGESGPKRRMGVVIIAIAGAVIAVSAGIAGLLRLSRSGAVQPETGSGTSAPPVVAMSRPNAGPDELQVVINKGKRRLTVFRGGKEIMAFPVVLGAKSNGDKQREGDGRTPEGTFYVCEKNEKSKYYLFIGLSYPNEEDAERGLRDGLITSRDRDAIVQAIKAHGKPPWYTRLGGEIGLHGGGTAWDWTEGCVGLDNGDMRQLYSLLRIGTTVIIEP